MAAINSATFGESLGMKDVNRFKEVEHFSFSRSSEVTLDTRCNYFGSHNCYIRRINSI